MCFISDMDQINTMDAEYLEPARIQASYDKLVRVVARGGADSEKRFLSRVEQSEWLQLLSAVMRAAAGAAELANLQGSGAALWLVSRQVSAAAQLCLEPRLRTLAGFRTLVEREWDGSRPALLLQLLDTAHQLLTQFPAEFEFSELYLRLLAHRHLASQHQGADVAGTSCSAPQFLNPGFCPQPQHRVLAPSCNISDLVLWDYFTKEGSRDLDIHVYDLKTDAESSLASDSGVDLSVSGLDLSATSDLGTSEAQSLEDEMGFGRTLNRQRSIMDRVFGGKRRNC